MPGLFDNALAYENARQARLANNKAMLEQMRAADAMQRMMLQQALIGNRVQTGPHSFRQSVA